MARSTRSPVPSPSSPSSSAASRLPSTSSLPPARTQPYCTGLSNPRQVVYDIVAQANQNPIPTSNPSDTRKATGALVLTGVLSALYSQSEWPHLAHALVRPRTATPRACSRSPTSTTSATRTARTPISSTPTRPSAATTPTRALRRNSPGHRKAVGHEVPDVRVCGRRRRCSPARTGSRTAPRFRWRPRRARRRGAGHRQPARPGNAVPGRDRHDHDPRARRAAHLERRGPHVLPAGQHLHRRLRGQLPDQRDAAAANTTCPA